MKDIYFWIKKRELRQISSEIEKQKRLRNRNKERDRESKHKIDV